MINLALIHAYGELFFLDVKISLSPFISKCMLGKLCIVHYVHKKKRMCMREHGEHKMKSFCAKKTLIKGEFLKQWTNTKDLPKHAEPRPKPCKKWHFSTTFIIYKKYYRVTRYFTKDILPPPNLLKWEIRLKFNLELSKQISQNVIDVVIWIIYL